MSSLLAQLRAVALKLPEVTEAPHFHYGSWRVRGKIFATLPPGDETLHLFVGEAVREWVLALAPEACERLLWGKKVLGLRVSLEQAPPDLLRQLVHLAWAEKAPKALVKQCPPPLSAAR